MLIVYAHPNKTGHCGYILKQVERYLVAHKKFYDLLDLYAENYDPVLKKEEHYTSGNYHLATDTLKYQALLKKHSEFIVIYPTWWNAAPAILKGWFDRVLTSKFAFEYINGRPHGCLSGRGVVITTTGGPAIYSKLFGGSRSLKVVTQNTLKFCGYKIKGYIIYSATQLTDKHKIKIEKTVNRAMRDFS